LSKVHLSGDEIPGEGSDDSDFPWRVYL
jgi:hypothetical protein